MSLERLLQCELHELDVAAEALTRDREWNAGMTLSIVNRFLESPLSLDQFLGREPMRPRQSKAEAMAGVMGKLERLRQRGKLKTAAEIEARMAEPQKVTDKSSE